MTSRVFKSFDTEIRESLTPPPALPTKNNGMNNNTTSDDKPSTDASQSTKVKPKKQTTSTYATPENFLEIELTNPQTHYSTSTSTQFTTYLLTTHTNIPLFKVREGSVRRRYSDFEKLKKILESQSTRVIIPSLPAKYWGNKRFTDEIIEERREGLEQFIRFVAGHPLLQTGCITVLRGFLQDEVWDGNGYW